VLAVPIDVYNHTPYLLRRSVIIQSIHITNGAHREVDNNPLKATFMLLMYIPYNEMNIGIMIISVKITA
jgi:hypothetical protein